MKMNCSHCKCIARLHSLHAAGLLFREHVYCCSNPYCGHAFIVHSEVGYTLTPSKIPNPNVHIPISARAAKRRENKEKREAAAASRGPPASNAADANQSQAVVMSPQSAASDGYQTTRCRPKQAI